MNKRYNDREKLHLKLDHLTDTEVKQVLTYVSSLETKHRDRLQPDSSEDELIVLLMSARENRRARQVFEWESARRRAEARAGATRYVQR